ncbi:MAG: DUF6084 family protein [Actinomycetota bacterium]|nr:DUF6084 family protein [Actinomycetota bacterium]
MSELVFDCTGVRAERYAAVPTLTFALRVAETTGERIHAIALRSQIRIEPARRHYSTAEQEHLSDLFGDPSRWGDTLKPLQFANVAQMVAGFTGSTDVDLPVVCTYDLEVAASRYFHGLREGVIPLLLLFSGTIFTRGEHGFSVEQIPWSKECTYRLPVAVWDELMQHHFPNSAWLRLHRDSLDALARFKTRRALLTWDDALQALLKEAGERG